VTDPAEPEMRTLSSTLVFESPWLRLREDRFVRPDGQTGSYGVVDKPDFAVVIPEQDGRFHLVEQYRYPIRRRSWEFPMGGWPAGRSGTPLELAQAELAEETGLRAADWTYLGHLHHAAGFCSQGFDLFLATGLTPGPPHREDTEVDMVQRSVDEAELRTMMATGGIVDAVTLAAYARLQLLRDGLG
jgi:8-oxo-dGTP pyrophosphatase MutT (NUDIX family)